MVRRIMTSKRRGQGVVALLDLGDRVVQLTQGDLQGQGEVGLKQALEARAGRSLPEVHLHLNRDGSLAVAVGEAPAVWPEDRAYPLEDGDFALP